MRNCRSYKQSWVINYKSYFIYFYNYLKIIRHISIATVYGRKAGVLLPNGLNFAFQRVKINNLNFFRFVQNQLELPYQ